MTAVGIRELKNNLSQYVRRVEGGERIAVTAHGRVVAELGPPQAARRKYPGRLDELIAQGKARPPLEEGDPLEGCPDIRLPPGTAKQLIDEDRDEPW
jgi:antitoxin (DNA-binding transcriptional repressor) of toxin-antitoxin stability system